MSEANDSKPRARHVARHAGVQEPAQVKSETPVKERAAGAPPKRAKATGKAASRRRRRERGEAKRIVRRSLALAAALVALLGVLAYFRPQINLLRVHRFIDSGRIDDAETLLAYMVRSDYDQGGIDGVRLDLAEYYFRQDDRAQVSALLRELPDDARTRELGLRLKYREAEVLLEAGEIDRGAQQFYLLGDYGDSASRCDDARTAIAMRTWLAGDVDRARRLFTEIDNPGAHVPAATGLLAIGGTDVSAVAGMEEFSTASLNAMIETYRALSQAREHSGGNRIAAGDRHTVGLKDDGHTFACGDNRFGQCNVSGWKDIVQVAAGAKHTVGLRLDGTVVATGDDSFGQCDVSTWTGVTAIAASAYGTLGLRGDGTVVATKLMQDRVSSWHGVTAIAGGSYSMGCLYGQGDMLCSHKAGQMDLAATLEQLSVCGAVSAGLGPDGRLVSSYEGAPDWPGLLDVAVTQTGFLGVSAEGQPLCRMFRESADRELSIEGRAVEIAGSGTHIVVLCDDGRVFAFGSNAEGQCEVSDWRL